MGNLAFFYSTYKISFLFILGSICCFIVAVYFVIVSIQPNTAIEFEAAESVASVSALSKPRGIVIDIAGGVINPGVYELPMQSRVEDAITMAGGFSPNADLIKVAKTVNRANRITDGMKLYIPIIDTSHNIIEKESSIQETTISINNASGQELESLPGVGPSTVAKIIAARPYIDLTELLSKKAVSKSVYEKIKLRISL